MKTIIFVLDVILKNPIDTGNENEVATITEQGKLTVTRNFHMDKKTLLPIQDIAIYLNDANVYGISGTFLDGNNFKEINTLFLHIQHIVLANESARRNINKNEFKKHYSK